MHEYLFSGASPLVILLGVAVVLVGLALATLRRHSLMNVLMGLTIADGGYLVIGTGLGVAGMTPAMLLLVFNGAARLLALVALKTMQNVVDKEQGVLTGVGKAMPVTATLFSLAMFAALGISPFLTPDAKPLLLSLAIDFQYWLLMAFLVAANCAMLVLTVIAVHALWQKGPYTYADSNWLTDLKRTGVVGGLLFLALAFMGIFGHDLFTLAADIAGQNASYLADFSVTWHPAVLAMYMGALLLLLLGFIHTTARNVAAVILPAIAFWLLFTDTAISPLGRFFGLIVSGIATLVALYSWEYIHKAATAYYVLLLLMFGSLAGLATAHSLGGFFVFWELMTLTSYALVAWEDTEKAHAAAKKYFIMCSVGAAIMLPGLLFFQYWYLELYIGPLAGIMPQGTLEPSPVPFAATLLLVLVGCGVKAGLFPGHSWLPDAHPAAPSSISAPLSGVLTKAGLFGIIQIFLVIFGFNLLGDTGQSGVPLAGKILCALGIITMVYGEVMALRQQELKRLLAYSTMGQIGEICMTLGLCTWLATTGALMHVLNHAIMKDLLFLCSGALIMRSGAHRLAELRGLGKAMPFTATCMVVGLIAILGLPPFAGFMSKFTMLYALAEVSPLLAGLMLLASLAGCIYYTRIIKVLIFEPHEGKAVAEAPWSMRIPMAVLAALCLLLGLFPQLGLNTMIMPVLAGLVDSGKIMAQTLPVITPVWPIHSILLLTGAIVPVLLKKNPKLAGQSAALLLALAAVLVILDRSNLDMLSFLFALAITIIGCVNMVYSVGYMDHSHTQWRFYSFFLCMCAGLTGVAVSKDIFSFFLFWEIMSSWSLYFVIVHEESPAALREGFKYFFFNVLGATFLFLGVVLIIQWCGGSAFTTIRNTLPLLAPWQAVTFLVLMATGFVMKAAQLPFRIDIQMHPATAPTPVSGYISSVLLKSAIFGLVKLFLVLGGGTAMAASLTGMPLVMDMVVWVGGITIVMAAMFAVYQSDIKLVLIYSTVSQLGYMVVATALGSSLGVAGGLLHLVNHIFFKNLLFLVAGAVILQTHRQSMNYLGGLGLRMPATLACFCIGAVCVIGLPPSNGFTSKWIIYHALMEQGYVLVAVLSLVGSVLTLAYMTKMLHSVFLGQTAPGLEEVKEAPFVMLIPMGLLVGGCLVTSLFPGAVLGPLNTVLAEYDLMQLDVAPWGLTSGAGAWNATLTALLLGVVWLAASLVLKRFSRRQRITTIHTCGIPPDKLNSRTNPGDIYSTATGRSGRWRTKQSTNGA